MLVATSSSGVTKANQLSPSLIDRWVDTVSVEDGKRGFPLKRTEHIRTWLPSFCQKTAGGGLPLVPQRKVTVRPGAVIWSRGRTTIWGGTAGEDTACLKRTAEINTCK